MPSTSESSLHSSTSSTNSEFCKICNLSAHGLHFGVVTCRACAAFFRRTVVESSQDKYYCRREENECVIKRGARYNCKACRFKKCIELGMTSVNIKWHRDSFYSKRNRSKKMIPHEEAERFKGITKPDGKAKTTVDVSETKQRICKILNSNPSKSLESRNFNRLEMTECALHRWREKQLPESEMEHLIELPITKLFKILTKQMLTMAEWLSYSLDFQKLEAEQKYQFFKLTWNIWRKFERYQMSLEMFGDKVVTEKKFAVDNQNFVTSATKLRFFEISDESDECLNRCFFDAWREMFLQITKPLQYLKPTTIEVAFMLSEICWQIAGKSMQGDILELSERVRDELANNLHDHYKSYSTQTNYAGRLIGLTKIVNSMIKFHTELKDRMAIVRIFDVFRVDLSEPDLFDL